MKSTARIYFLSICIFSFCAVFFSCKKDNPAPVEEVHIIEKKVLGHKWFCLTKDGFKQIDLPQHADTVLQKPWTEALRISCMASSSEKTPLDVDEENAPKVYALVNRLGIMVMGGRAGQPLVEVYKDDSFFAERTADKLVFMKGTPVFALYRNSYFNEKISSLQKFRPFLVQFSADSGVYFPILTYENLSLGDNSEINDFCWNGSDWFCSIKTFSESETNFSYLKFKPETALLSISPEKNFISIDKSTEEEFRAQRSPKKFSAAPERLQKLLKSIPPEFDFYAECKESGGPTAREFVHSNKADPKRLRRAVAQLSGTWICALFEDGTVYINGALYGKTILNGGNTIAMRLPKLPEGYKYSDFGISGTNFFGAWEQTDFYKTGRSGFIYVDLNKILYGAGQ